MHSLPEIFIRLNYEYRIVDEPPLPFSRGGNRVYLRSNTSNKVGKISILIQNTYRQC